MLQAVEELGYAPSPLAQGLATGRSYAVGILLSDFASPFFGPILEALTRELLAITALIALGSPKELATHLEGALRVGATEREVREAILQSALFLGFPRALAAMKLFQKVLKGRGAPHEGEG